MIDYQQLFQKSEQKNQYLKELHLEFRKQFDTISIQNDQYQQQIKQNEFINQQYQERVDILDMENQKQSIEIINLQKQILQFNKLFSSINQNGKYDKLLQQSKQLNNSILEGKNQYQQIKQPQQEKNNRLSVKINDRSNPNEILNCSSNNEGIEHLSASHILEKMNKNNIVQQADLDPERLFEEFVIIGIDKNDLKGLDKNQVVLQPKILGSFPDAKESKNAAWKKMVHEFCFSSGCQAWTLNESEKVTSYIYQTEIKSSNQNSFVFTFTNDESYLMNKFNKQLLNESNPSKYLYVVCLMTQDYYCIENENQQQYWGFQKVYCFVTLYPFFDFFFDAIFNMISWSQENRKVIYSEQVRHNSQIIQTIDSDQINHSILNNQESLMNLLKLNFIEFNKSIKLNYFDKQISYKIKNENNAYLTVCQWSAPICFSNLSLDDLLFIFFSIMQEYSVIFISNNLRLLTSTVQNKQLIDRLTLNTLLHPFRWPHSIILNLPEILYEFFESPFPILIGLNKSLEFIRNIDLLDKYPHFIFVCLDDNLIFSTQEHKKDIFKSIPDFNNLKQQMRSSYYGINKSTVSSLYSKNKTQTNNILIYQPKYEETNQCEVICQQLKEFLDHVIVKWIRQINFQPGQIDIVQIEKILKKNNSKNNYHFIEKFVQTQIFTFFIENNCFQ